LMAVIRIFYFTKYFSTWHSM